MSLGSFSSPSTLATPARRSARKSTFRVAALALALFAGVACGDDPTDPITPGNTGSGVELTLNASTVKLIRSDAQPNPTTTITPTVKGTTNTGVTYTSGDTRIATVSSTGVVTAVADGSTFIMVKSVADPSVNRSVVVNVVSTVVMVSPATMYSYPGGPTRQLSVTVENNPNTNVTWSSSNTAVATVSATGLVTPVGAGTANIIATSVGDPSKSAATVFTVDPAPDASFTQATAGTSYAISGAVGTQQRFFIILPAGTTELKATIAGPNGDADIYLYPGSATLAQMSGLSTSAALCVPWLSGSNESCTVANPQPRLYYVVIDAYSAYTGGTFSFTTKP